MWMNAKVLAVRHLENGGARVEVGDTDSFGRYSVYIDRVTVSPGDDVVLKIDKVGVTRNGGIYMSGQVQDGN